mmetsp:Transcript_12419/g.26171  ORF Transcript_12419/g.26171 Transcript_12419/m.26171 type:complete len:85 (+) Transcript_12419:427-681(+)
MIRCNHPATRLHWRRKAVRRMKTSMEKHNVENSIVDVLCTCITEWLDTGSVAPSNYPHRYTDAIVSQTFIGGTISSWGNYRKSG